MGVGYRRGVARPWDAPKWPRRAQRALLAVGRVPYAAAHSRASSISPPAIEAGPDAAARANSGAWLGPGAHPSGLSVPNAHNGPCPKPVACPTRRRTAGLARPHHLRSARNATCEPGVVGRCGATQGRTRAVSACPTRATHPALSRPRTPTRRRTAVPARSHRLQSVRNATCRPGGAGRCRAAVLGNRMWWRPSAKGEQQLHRLHACLELRRHPWHSDSSLLEPTSSRRDPPPSMKPVCHRDGAAASPTGARTARRRQSPEPPPASACCWYV